MSLSRPIAGSFVVAAPAGARVRTRLRLSDDDAAVLRQVGTHLGSLAGRDLAARCREGELDARQTAQSRRERKRALTAGSSSRWAGAITRTSQDTYRLAVQNLHAERASLRARIRKIDARLAVPVGARRGRLRGYPSKPERHAKTIRVQALRARLGEVEVRLDAGRPRVVRGGRRLLRARNNLTGAGLTETEWRKRWEAARLFLTADGEADKAQGNETIRWHPDEGWLEIKLPVPLAHLANRPHGRYRLSGDVTFPYRGDEVAAQAASGAVRYDISFDPEKGRWYLDASWRPAPAPPPSLGQLQTAPVVAVDVNTGHLAVAVLAPDGNILGQAETIPLDLTGLPASQRDGRLRAVISHIVAAAKRHDAQAVVIENLNFTQARAEGREHTGSRPCRGRRGRRFRRLVAGIPTARFRDRLTQMTHNAGLHVVAVDPAYTSRWAAEHWLPHLKRHHPTTTGHHAAALVIGRRGLGYRARRRATGNRPAPAEAARSTPPRSRTHPVPEPAPQETRHPDRPTAATRHETRTPRQTMAGNQATQHRPGPPTKRDSVPLSV